MPAAIAAVNDVPNPIRTRDGIIRAKPIALVYIRPLRFFNAHLSAIGPPTITPMKEAKAIVIVAMGPATDISTPRLSANNVGNQFFVAHPGTEHDAKKDIMVQKAMLVTSMPNEPFMASTLFFKVSSKPSFRLSDFCDADPFRFS